MEPDRIQVALADIRAEADPSLRTLKLASLIAAVFRDAGIELVVVGGSAIELLTEGAYTSGDIDLCLRDRDSIGLRDRQDLMAKVDAVGGPRSWKVAGTFVDLLGRVESVARTPFREISGPHGPVRVMQPEELLVERVLVSEYPNRYPPARDCARKLIAVSLGGGLNMDWNEVARIASLREYKNEESTRNLVEEVRNELRLPGAPHPD